MPYNYHKSWRSPIRLEATAQDSLPRDFLAATTKAPMAVGPYTVTVHTLGTKELTETNIDTDTTMTDHTEIIGATDMTMILHTSMIELTAMCQRMTAIHTRMHQRTTAEHTAKDQRMTVEHTAIPQRTIAEPMKGDRSTSLFLAIRQIMEATTEAVGIQEAVVASEAVVILQIDPCLNFPGGPHILVAAVRAYMKTISPYKRVNRLPRFMIYFLIYPIPPHLRVAPVPVQ